MVLGVILAIVGIVALAGSYFAYRFVFYASREKESDPYTVPPGEQYEKTGKEMNALVRRLDEIPYEQVWITSFDGIKLAGRYYHVSDSDTLQIQMHGYHGTGLRDFCGGNKVAREMGQNTLIIDQRAHGKSEGHTICFGVKERYDCLSWANYASERFGKDMKIILAGLSMGAATVLMASELDLPSNVVGIIADCPYSSPKAIISKVGGVDMKLPAKLIYPFVWLGALLYGHFVLSASSAAEAVKHASVPVLLIHGEDDRFVPCEMSREIYRACASDIRLETFPDAGHGISYFLDTEKYERVTREFIESVCGTGNHNKGGNV